MIKDLLILTIFPGCMAFAAAYDLFTMTVPNRIAIILVAGFVCLVPFVGLSLQDVAIQLGLGLGALALGIVLFSGGWIGGGDAKLFAATVLWLPPNVCLAYVAGAGIFGGMLTMAILGYRRLPLPVMLMQQNWIARLHDTGEGVPYGIALAAAGLLTYSYTPFFLSLGH